MAVKTAAMRACSTIVSWVYSMVGKMVDCWAGMIVAIRAGSTVVSLVTSMVGLIAKYWAGQMVVVRVV